MPPEFETPGFTPMMDAIDPAQIKRDEREAKAKRVEDLASVMGGLGLGEMGEGASSPFGALGAAMAGLAERGQDWNSIKAGFGGGAGAGIKNLLGMG
jgi:hypothetical protein